MRVLLLLPFVTACAGLTGGAVEQRVRPTIVSPGQRVLAVEAGGRLQPLGMTESALPLQAGQAVLSVDQDGGRTLLTVANRTDLCITTFASPSRRAQDASHRGDELLVQPGRTGVVGWARVDQVALLQVIGEPCRADRPPFGTRPGDASIGFIRNR